MNRIVYFADKSVLFTSIQPDDPHVAVLSEAEMPVSRDKILKILESNKSVAVVSCNPEAAFRTFSADFTAVVAAGGVVYDDCGRSLMIHRNGRWDLPKGHLEKGERLDECAVREIAEETSVEAEIVRPLCETLHAYWFPQTQRWELKRTHWYLLHAAACGQTAPQSEEGIDRAVWCAPDEVAAHAVEAFPTVRTVIECMKNS